MGIRFLDNISVSTIPIVLLFWLFLFDSCDASQSGPVGCVPDSTMYS